MAVRVDFLFEHKLPPATCPTYRAPLDGATATQLGDMNRPNPGDATLCAYCGHPGIYTEGLKLRAFGAADWIEVAQYREFQELYRNAQFLRDAWNAKRGKKPE